MKHTLALCIFLLAPLAAFGAAAVPPESLAKKGAILFSDDFTRNQLGDSWHEVVPTFTITDGTLKGSQTRDDHGAVASVQVAMKDGVTEFRFCLAGATSINAVWDDKAYQGSHAGHICRATITPKLIRLGDDKEGGMRNDIFAMRKDPKRKAEGDKLLAGRTRTFPATIANGSWYRMRIEIAGDEMCVSLDDQFIGSLKSPGIAHPTKSNFHFTVSGKDALLDDVRIWTAAAKPTKPNIVFILADDMGPGDLGCYGGQQSPTPRIDQFAKEGVRFTQYYSASPICSPSRTGLLTGMFPARWRITSYLQDRKGNRACGQADFLDPKAPSVAQALRAAGYATGHFGKWHMGGGRDVTDAPKFAAYGFEEHAGTWESPEPHPEITAGNWIWGPNDKVKRWNRTAFFVDKALDFLDRHKGQPCFVQVWPDDVHTPWVPDDHSPAGDTPANFHPVLCEMDKQLGRLFDGIRQLGLDERTLIIFASDNGALPTFQGARSAGLRGSKLSLYEGGVRLPFIARWPGHVPTGRVDDETVFAAVDLLPTLCAISGAVLPDDAALDGEDRSAALWGKGVARSRALFWEYGRNTTAFKYPAGRDRSPNLAVREGPWKLLINADGSGAELYNVVTDRAEEHDVAAQQSELTHRLRQAALTWRESLP
jgi:arylsulfatase A-like enzyme